MIEKNERRFEKTLHAVREPESIAVYNHALTDKQEADWIATTAKELIEKGVAPCDIAVLYRAHFVSRSIEEALIREKVPYRIHSGIGFYARKEVKDVLCYLRMLVNPDDVAFLRTVNEPRRGVGKKRIQYLEDYQSENGGTLFDALVASLDNELFAGTGAKDYVALIHDLTKKRETEGISDLVKDTVIDSGYEEHLKGLGDEDRLENTAELMASITRYEEEAGEKVTLEDYLAQAALYSSSDEESEDGKITLMTMHAAKGLEFPVVFACCMSEGIIPSRNTKTKDQLEEERRVAYVAMTRAKDALFVSDSEGVNHEGLAKCPSRFIFNIERSALHYTNELRKELIDKVAALQEPGSKGNNDSDAVGFHVGDVVGHPVFGRGVVEGISVTGGVVIKFDKLQTTREIDPAFRGLSLLGRARNEAGSVSKDRLIPRQDEPSEEELDKTFDSVQLSQCVKTDVGEVFEEDSESGDSGLPDAVSCDEASGKPVEPSSVCAQEIVEEELTRVDVREDTAEKVELMAATRIVQNPPMGHEESEPLKKRGLPGLLKSIFGR